MGEKINSLTKKQILFLAAGIAAIIIIIVICSIVAVNHNKIDLADAYTVKVEGIDTQGTARCEINEKSLETILLGKNIDAFRGNILLESMKCNLSKKDNLKNGDKIIITTTYDETVAKQLNLSFKNTEKVIEVSGLTKGKEVDVFKDLKVTYTGTSPDGEVSAISTSSDPFISKVNFIPSKEKVSNGDKITIEAVFDKEEAITQKALVKEKTKAYTVSGLPEYLKHYSQLNSDNVKVLGEMVDKSLTQFLDHNMILYPSFNPFIDHHMTYNALKHEKCVVVTRKSNVDVPFGFPLHNAFILISSAEVYDNGKQVATTYLATPIQEVIISTDKSIQGKAEKPKDYDTLDEAEASVQKDYSSYNIEIANNN